MTANGTNVPIDSVPSVKCCAVHLQLLELFVDLRQSVEEWVKSSVMDVDGVWEVFVELSVVRFTLWLQRATRCMIEMEITVPLLDIMMAWHSLMLSPHTYHAFSGVMRGDDAGL